MLRRLPTLLTIALGAAVVLATVAPASTSHKGWPKINGQLYINRHDLSQSHTGTHKNDELLGGHGNDTIAGVGGKDVLWGDYKPSGNNESQQDTLDGGPGNDFIYASHGTNSIQGGTGADIIHAHFGRGAIDCGPGRDILFISHRSKPGYQIANCEHISFKTAGK
jgi:Ca2+-binding RTX toxin-like protein